MQGAVVHKHRSNVSATLVKRRLDNRTRGLAVGIGLQVKHIGLEQHLLHEFVHANTFLSRDILTLVLAAPILNKVVHVGQLLLDLLGISSGLINLVDGKDDGHTSSRRVIQGLNCLRHDAIIGSDNHNNDVGYLGTTGTHSSKCFVTRGIQEGDATSVG